MKELPADWLSLAFEHTDQGYCVRSQFRAAIQFLQQDIRTQIPEGRFHLILCRNLVFTYFGLDRQQEILTRLTQTLWASGILVTGKHEVLPPETTQFKPVQKKLGIYRRCSNP